MPLPHAYTSPCTIQLLHCVINLASPFHRPCLMHGAARASHRAAPHHAPPRPAANVDVGAPSVKPSAHANRAGASGEVDVVDDGTNAAGGVVASEWLAANLGCGVFAAGGTGARISANNDAQSDNDDDDPASALETLLGR